MTSNWYPGRRNAATGKRSHCRRTLPPHVALACFGSIDGAREPYQYDMVRCRHATNRRPTSRTRPQVRPFGLYSSAPRTDKPLSELCSSTTTRPVSNRDTSLRSSSAGIRKSVIIIVIDFRRHISGIFYLVPVDFKIERPGNSPQGRPSS